MLKVGLETQSLAAGDSNQPDGADFTLPTPAELADHFAELDILELVGQGGMGVVYKARQKHLDRLVALKILSPKIAGQKAFAERFAREARALGLLSHPNIVAVYDFGQKDHLFYFLMEFVDGVNLRQLLDAGQLAPHEALAIVPQVCDALQYAHDHGVVHRDIKPENILLDKSGRAKIADFGLAKLVGRQPKDLSLTGSGQVMGTPHYMAPEQMERPQQVDHRADIYSLGVVFYQMLTGELPLGRFAPPSKKVQIDVRLDHVVLRALEKEPELRYQQANEVKTEVDTIVHTLPPSAAAPHGPALRVKGADRDEAASQVKAPAIGLVVTGAFNWVLFTLITVVLALAHVTYQKAAAAAEPLPWSVSTVAGMPAFPQMMLAALAGMASSGYMIFAGLNMMRLERWGAALAASILALFVSPGNLIGLPLGIWSLVVLARPEVRSAFLRRPRDAGRTASPLVIRVLRWTARLLGTLLLLLFAVFVVAEGIPPAAAQPGGVQIELAAMLLMWIGLAIGWRWEGWAALLTLSAFGMFNLVEGLAGQVLRLSPFHLVALVGILYGVCWWHSRRRAFVGDATSAQGNPAVSEMPDQGGAVPPVRFKPVPDRRDVASFSEPQPRFSRTAIVGAAWAPWFFVMAFLSMFAVQVEVSQGASSPQTAWWQVALSVTVLPLGLLAPFGTTLLGAIAVAQIRRSGGRLHGLGLALSDVLLFPLLVLDALIAWGWYETLAIIGRLARADTAATPDLFFVLLLTVLTSAAVDVLIIRWAWRAAVKPQLAA
jgi:tRNA A-37 threonylcarbamoyl transferase component Bud32